MKKIIIIFFILLLFFIYCFYPIITYKQDFSKLPGRVLIYDRNSKIITNKSKENGYFKSIMLFSNDFETSSEGQLLSSEGQLYKNNIFIKSLLKIEDKNFYNHYGIDLLSKLRAIKNNIFAGKILGGASTITEQFIKNKYFLNNKRTFLQKGREAILALYFSIFYDKKYILKSYLNSIYFGNNIYGIGGAIEVYFNKDKLKDLTKEEIILLISLLHTPSVKSLKEKAFTEYFEKTKKRLGFKFKKTIFKLNKKENIDIFSFVTQNILERNINKKEIIIHSSVDFDLQQFSKNILNKTLQELKDKNVTNGAILAINPKTMEVLVYQGSKDFKAKDIEGQVDVIKSKRQPGSTIKPFLYLLALQSGANPDDLIIDMESEYNSFKEGKTYISENYSLREYGIVRLKKALGNSLNNATVRLARELGLQKVWQFYKDYGFKLDFGAEHYGYSLVLGNPDITLEDLVLSYTNLLPDYKVNNTRKLDFFNNSYYDLNNNSEQNNYHSKQKNCHPEQNNCHSELVSESLLKIDNLQDPEINLGGQFKKLKIQELNKIDSNKLLLYDILKDPDNRDISFGVNSILNTSIRQAVKTGTSSDFRDNWIVSYHPDLIVGIWIGNNDNSSMIGVTGITGAGYIWHQIIEKAIELGYIKDDNYDIPENIEETNYCLDKKCFRKELIFQKKGKKYYSRIRNNYFDKRDLFENPSDYEKEKLEQMGFEMR